jgi:large subunit ribosomal protein L14e
MEDIFLGQIVHSKTGRDKGRYFIVVSIVDANYVLIVDGDLRKIDNPKKKRIKHLVFHDRIATEIQADLEQNKQLIDSQFKKCLQSIGLL